MYRLFSLRKVCTAGALCLTLAAAALPAGAATLVVAATKTKGLAIKAAQKLIRHIRQRRWARRRR